MWVLIPLEAKFFFRTVYVLLYPTVKTFLYSFRYNGLKRGCQPIVKTIGKMTSQAGFDSDWLKNNSSIDKSQVLKVTYLYPNMFQGINYTAYRSKYWINKKVGVTVHSGNKRGRGLLNCCYVNYIGECCGYFLNSDTWLLICLLVCLVFAKAKFLTSNYLQILLIQPYFN